MSFRNPLNIDGRQDGRSFALIVEPWASEYTVEHGENCAIVAIHPSIMPTFGVSLHETDLVVYINEGGSTYEFWRDANLVDEMAIPIPT